MTRAIYWFRTDLRLHDSPSLQAVLDLKPEALFPLWCWDPNYVYKHRVGLNRFRFLLESMQDLSDNVNKTNALSQLLVVRGDPVLLLPELFKRWNISHLVFEKDVNGYARQRDAEVIEAAKKAGVTVINGAGRYLWDVEEVVQRAEKPVTSLKMLEGIVSKMPSPPRPIDAPKSLPSPLIDSKSRPKDLNAILTDIHSSLQGLPSYSSKPGPPRIDLNSAELGGQRTPGGKVTCYDTVDGPDTEQGREERFTVPTLASLGMDPKQCGAAEKAVVPGGETEALRRLETLCKDHEYVATFSKPKTSPSCDTLQPSTTLLSPFLKFGCLSIRRLWHDTKDSSTKYKGGSKTSPPENYEGQLLFREMYAAAELAVGDPYQVIRSNRICRYMDWYLPNQYEKDGTPIEPRPRGDDESEARLAAYRAGQTGFPWIDAGIRQLRYTGWCHHLMRHSLAAFLTRGQCWISWERGAEMFEEWLLDWDPNANAGNWMWLSCSAFFSQFFRVYGLATFPAKYDKNASLVRQYCPELKDMPDKYVYAPHTAPLDVQKKAKCIIGTDYPYPILDEKEEKQRCLNRCKAAYDAKLYGNSPAVLEGKAQGMLRKKHGEPDPKPPKKKAGSDNKIPGWAKAGHEAQTTTDGGSTRHGGAAGGSSKEDEDDQDAPEMEPEQTDEHDHDYGQGDDAPAHEVPAKRGNNKSNSDAGSPKRSRRS